MLARASGAVTQIPATGKIAKPEKTRPGNPNQLTVKQHVFPVRSMLPFVDKKGQVCVFDMVRGKQRSAKPKNEIFCALRAWDQQTELAMKLIEDKFQEVVQPIITGKVNTVAAEQKPAIDSMLALWSTRTYCRRLDTQEIQLTGVPGHDLTKEQEENLEKNGYKFVRMGGKMPARQLNGLEIQLRVGHCVRAYATALKGWGVVQAQSGEFIVPDIPLSAIIPLSPKLALVASADGTIFEQNVVAINNALRAGCSEYYFAHDLSKCQFSG